MFGFSPLMRSLANGVFERKLIDNKLLSHDFLVLLKVTMWAVDTNVDNHQITRGTDNESKAKQRYRRERGTFQS